MLKGGERENMKKIVKIISIIFVLALGTIIITGCSKKEERKSLETVIYEEDLREQQGAKEKILDNIRKETLGLTQDGDYIIKLTNNNNKDVSIGNINVKFIDENGNVAEKNIANDCYFVIPANKEIITYVNGSYKNLGQYVDSEIDISISSQFYEYRANNFEIETINNTEDEEIEVILTNNNDIDLEYIKVNVVFTKDNSVVAIEDDATYKGIGANGGKITLNVDYPYDSNTRENIQFDKYTVYLTSAYRNPEV